MQAETRLEPALANKRNRIATTNFSALFHKRFTEMRIERLHMLQVFNFHRKPKATMLADFNNFTRARRIYSIAFGSQEVHTSVRELLIRERIENHFKTSLDIVMILERMQHRDMRGKRRISLKLVQRLAECRPHCMQILFRRLVFRNIFKRETKATQFECTIADNTCFFNLQNRRIDHGTDFLDFVLDDRILVIDIHQVAVRQILHNLHWREHNESKDRTDS